MPRGTQEGHEEVLKTKGGSREPGEIGKSGAHGGPGDTRTQGGSKRDRGNQGVTETRGLKATQQKRLGVPNKGVWGVPKKGGSGDQGTEVHRGQRGTREHTRKQGNRRSRRNRGLGHREHQGQGRTGPHKQRRGNGTGRHVKADRRSAEG